MRFLSCEARGEEFCRNHLLQIGAHVLFSSETALCYTAHPMSSSVPPSPGSPPSRPVFDAIAAALNGLFTVIRKLPGTMVFAVILIILYYRQSHQPAGPELEKFRDPGKAQTEPQPPADLPEGTNPSVWRCIHKVDSLLSKGLWADVYYGMEARLDGKMLVAKVTEKWKDLSDEKRQTVAKLIVDTWIENGRALHILNSGDELEEVVIKQLPDDQTVAAWKPTTGVQLFAQQAGA